MIEVTSFNDNLAGLRISLDDQNQLSFQVVESEGGGWYTMRRLASDRGLYIDNMEGDVSFWNSGSVMVESLTELRFSHRFMTGLFDAERYTKMAKTLTWLQKRINAECDRLSVSAYVPQNYLPALAKVLALDYVIVCESGGKQRTAPISQLMVEYDRLKNIAEARVMPARAA